MKKLYTYLLVLTFFTLVAEDALAQRSIGQYRGNLRAFNKNRRYWMVGGSINAMNYFGDLAPKNRIASTDISFTRPGIGITAERKLGTWYSFRGSFMWGRLKGDDATSELGSPEAARHVRNLHFRNDIKELSAMMVFDLKAHSRTFITRPEFVPYLFAGIAVFHHNPWARVPEFDYVHYDVTNPSQIQDNDERYGGVSPDEWVELKPLRTEDKNYSNFAFAIPVGAGVRYKVNRYWNLAFEISYRQTFTDYVDDVSNLYRDPESFGEGPQANLARIMAYRSNELDVSEILSYDRFRFLGSEDSAHPWSNPLNPQHDIYQRFAGYGLEDPVNIRGKDDKDVYLVTSISLTYILGTNLRNAKFR
ncbi:DUF6089 family protein [Cesiribacter sp. SM1]|uniref:DUF6089 family protein n=1 Tax=Cesiribacter sp. SM1 TaxID=2861196 RepID=UPI001CD21393|nr:DUF6089 family protein [Cesiribacter sp. SM1]